MEKSTKILSDITVHMKYGKFLPTKQRRETWDELVDRNKSMHLKKYPKLHKEIEEAYQFVYARKVLPSMRSMQFAGKPIELNPARIYNCSFLPINHPDCLPELMFLLLSGVGVGYSVQRHHVEQLPEIIKPRRSRRYLVGDSIEGWADSIKVLVSAYFGGKPLPVFDFSDIRPKGAALITSGGKAPGPEPLKECLQLIKDTFDSKQDGERLSTLDVHDICCYVADAVLAGGIRRSAMIALFDLDDDEMLKCKSDFACIDLGEWEQNGMLRGYVEYQDKRFFVTLSEEEHKLFGQTGTLPWYHFYPARGRSNNSATILRHKIDKKTFMELWKVIEASNAGEPGFFFTNDKEFGLNPCAEISLRAFQFCNLTTINAATIESQMDLNARARAAALIGTLQAGYTNFHYLREIWQKTTEKEALIGVSMTGISAGSVLLLNLAEAAEIVKDENERVAKLIGINKAARATTVKPEGTTSLVVGSSSGIHAWHDKYYIRRIRVGKNEAIYAYLSIFHPELLEDDVFKPNLQAVISVPQKAPTDAITRDESAIDLLNRVSQVWSQWVKTGHRKGSNVNNVSTTVSIKSTEWKEVGEWMWTHRDEFTALSVLPYDSGTYLQAPFETISKKKYEELMKSLTEVDLSKVIEVVDNTTLQENLACFAGACEVK